MGKAELQKRWRANTTRKRIEVYLPADVVEQLDAWAKSGSQSRAAVISGLIRGVVPEPASAAAQAPEPVETRETPASQAPAPEDGAEIGYKLRRPRSADEQRYDWIAVTDQDERIALGPDPVRFHKWSGHYISGSLFGRDAKGASREAVVRDLIDRDYLYR